MSEEEVDIGQLLRSNLFTGDLIQLPPPDEGLPDFLPAWFTGPLAALVYPPISERNVEEGASIDLQISPYHIYYGTLRELAETADEERADALRRMVLELNPNAALEIQELARAGIENDVESALLHYELALELDPELYEARQDAGMCQLILSNIEGEDREDRLASAEEMFRSAIDLRPNAGLSWWSLARALQEQGQPEDSAAVLQQYLDEYPEGDHREMVEQALVAGFEEAMPGQPTPEQQVFLQAQQLAFGEDPAGAVTLLEPMTEQYPDAGELWFVLGVAHRRSGAPDEAERCLRRAARLSGTEPFIWLELSRAYVEMQQWRDAEAAIRKALELDAENPGFLCELGRILLAQGDRFSAREVIEQAYNMVPDDPEVQEAWKAVGGAAG